MTARLLFLSHPSKLRRCSDTVTPACTAWSSRVTANRPAISRAFASRTTDSGTVGTPCTWRAHGDSFSVIGERDISSMPKKFPVPARRRPRTIVSGTIQGKWETDSPRFVALAYRPGREIHLLPPGRTSISRRLKFNTHSDTLNDRIDLFRFRSTLQLSFKAAKFR